MQSCVLQSCKSWVGATTCMLDENLVRLGLCCQGGGWERGLASLYRLLKWNSLTLLGTGNISHSPLHLCNVPSHVLVAIIFTFEFLNCDIQKVISIREVMDPPLQFSRKSPRILKRLLLAPAEIFNVKSPSRQSRIPRCRRIKERGGRNQQKGQIIL